MLSSAPGVTIITYPGIGHMAAEEAGPAIAKDIQTWLAAPAVEREGGSCTAMIAATTLNSCRCCC